MKNKISFVVALLLFSTFAFAQKSLSGTAASAVKASGISNSTLTNPSTLLSQLTGAINTEAFTENFKSGKVAWEKKNNSANSAAGWAGSLMGLQRGLNENAMTSGWGAVKEKWLKGVQAATTVQEVANLAAQLEGNINPKLLNADWASQRSTWLSAIKALGSK